MSKQKNPTIGTCKCTTCTEVADVRQTGNGKLYLHCKVCGTDTRHGPGFQKFIRDNATFTEGHAAAPGPVTEPAPDVINDDEADLDEDITERRGNPARETVRPRAMVDGDDNGNFLSNFLRDALL